MALEVEDGTGKADADAFVSVDACTTYCEAQGLSDWGEARDSDADEAAIRRATTWLSAAFSWKGLRANGRDQALAWPRTDVEDAEGWTVASDEVPAEVVNATAVAAAYELANPGGLNPTVTMTDRIKREKVAALEVEYFAAAGSAEAAKPVLTLVQSLIAGLLDGGSNRLVGTASRR